jgi:hypothetical protein
MSYSRDSGAPAYGDANTNIRVDFVYGNMPMQPNEDRSSSYKLSAGDSHAIALTEWNAYPTTDADPVTNILINDGRTLDDGESFYWPAVGLCNTWGIGENRLETVKKEFIACGVPASWLTDAQWTSGANSYDYETGTYDTNSGRIFYYYIAPSSDMGYDATGVRYYGADFDRTVMYGSEGPNYKSGNQSADKNDFYLVVFQSKTPSLNTADWL